LTGIWRAIVGGRIVEWTSRGVISVSSRVKRQRQQRAEQKRSSDETEGRWHSKHGSQRYRRVGV
jgi:hypothetical protein